MELPTMQIDGMDVAAVREAAIEVVGRARGGDGPQFVEARTYRFHGHSRSDPGKYRPPGELEQWRERDPLTVAAAFLRDGLGVDGAEVTRVEQEVEAALDDVQAAALAAPFPESVSIPEFNDG
jgi:acetoin:2,6-dichlorophenolindophenol oxidoreductase subunit alpha